MLRYAFRDEKVCQSLDHMMGGDLSLYGTVQAFPRVLVDDVQDPECPAIVRPRRHEIVAPYMVLILWPESDARTIIQPQPPSFRLLLRYLQTFSPPNPLYPLMVYLPSLIIQKTGNPPIPVPSVRGG